MKKAILGLMLAGALVFGATGTFFAEEETETVSEVPEVDYSMMTGAFEGAWVTCFGTFDLYLPADWDVLVNADLTEEAPENNVYFQAANEDQTRSAAISAVLSDAETVNDLEAGLVEQGAEEIGYMYINGIYCLTYTIKAEVEAGEVETAGFCALGENGVLYNVTLGAMADDDEFGPIASDILLSFSATEYEEVETEA